MPQIPEYFDPYVGKVYGNILDYYDNATYNLKLYMVEKSYTENAPAEFGLAEENLTAPPGATVILAQTGVTGTQIDNLEIASVVTANDGPQANTIKFTIKQPGAATFPDQIQLAKVYLDHENTSHATMFLEIRFQGYRESDLGPSDVEWDPDTGGDPEIVAGPFRYKIQPTQIRVGIDSTGSTYEFETVATASYAFRDDVYKIPKTLNTLGKTIQEHVDDLEKKLNELQASSDSEVKDVITFDTGKLIAAAGGGSSGGSSYDLIDDETLISNTDPDAEDTNRVINLESIESADAIERQKALEDNPKDSGETAEQEIEQDKISVAEGTSIHDYFLTLLSMNEEYISKISRKSEIDNPEDDDVDQDQAFISWLRMNADTKQLGFDKRRNKYAQQYTFIPTIYKSTRRDVAVDVRETEIKDARKVIDQFIENGTLLKSYNYMFTGLNDQIQSLDIRYDQGLDLLLPPKGGAMGDISITATDSLSNTVPEAKDLSIEGQVNDFLNKAEDAVEKSSLKGLFDDLKDLLNTATGAVDQLASAVGLSSAQLIDLVNFGTNANKEAFIEQLDAATTKQLNANINISTTSPTVLDPTIAPDYKPEFSGYAYGSDFLNPGVAYPSVTLLENLGYINIQDKLASAGITEQEALESKQGTSSTTDTPSKVAGGTYKAGSVQNKLLGFIAGSHSDTQFMTEIDLGIRGDPWYLGASGSGLDGVIKKSDEVAANHKGDDNCFFLNINAPITYDPDYTDEDSQLNSGYWDMSGEARTFGGVYRITKVTNKFNGGIFTSDVRGQRVVPIQPDAKTQTTAPTTAATTAPTDNQDSPTTPPTPDGT